MTTLTPIRRAPERLWTRLLGWELGGTWRFVYVTVAIVGTALIFSRRPDAFLNPQFYGNDGPTWFADAWNHGPWANLLHQHNGYLGIWPRSVALVADYLPLTWAPAVFNFAALVAQLAPAVLLAGPRGRGLIRSDPLRLFGVVLYFAVPNSADMNMILSTSEWHLALLAGMVLALGPAEDRAGAGGGDMSWTADAGGDTTRTAGVHTTRTAGVGVRKATLAADAFVVALSALSGPYAFLLVPVALVQLFRSYKTSGVVNMTWAATMTAVTTAASICQLISLLGTPAMRHAPLGTSPHRFWHIVGGQLVIAPIIGVNHGLSWLKAPPHGIHEVASAAGIFFAVAVMVKGGPRHRLLATFALMVLTASLLSPAPYVDGNVPAWQAFGLAGWGLSYWFIPTVVELWLLLALLEKVKMPARAVIAALLAAVCLIAVPGDWTYPKFINFHYGHDAARLNKMPPHQSLTFPENPRPYHYFTLFSR